MALAGSAQPSRSSPATAMCRSAPSGLKPPCTSRPWFSTIAGRSAAASIDSRSCAQSVDRCSMARPCGGIGNTLKWPSAGVVTSVPRTGVKCRRTPAARAHAVEVDARVVLGRDRQLDALAGEGQHPLVDGRVAVARERAGMHVRIHRGPAARVHLAADGQAVRRGRALRQIHGDAVHAVLEAAAGVDHVPARGQLQPRGAGGGCRPRPASPRASRPSRCRATPACRARRRP